MAPITTFREELLARRSIVRSDEGLQERQLRKHAILHEAAVAAFARRGLDRLDAAVAGRLAVTIYDATLERWLDDGATTHLDDILRDVVDAVVRVSSSVP